MTRGILTPETYYYRRVFADGVRAVEAAQAHPSVNGKRVAVTGGSQGGGIAVAVAALSPAVSVAMPDVPFLAITGAPRRSPRASVRGDRRYLLVHRDKVEQVFATLSYFDGVNFADARQGQSAVLGRLDGRNLPTFDCVFAAYNHWAGKKEIRTYEYNHHEGGGAYQTVEKLKYLTKLW